MSKIEVEIKEIDNGWLVDDSFFGEETFFKTFIEAKNYAFSLFTKFEEEEVKESNS